MLKRNPPAKPDNRLSADVGQHRRVHCTGIPVITETMRLFAVLCLLMTTVVAAASPVHWGEDLDAAMRTAEQRQTLVLVDFYAPWCYSCYFMDENVLSMPELATYETQLEFVKLDADAAPGAAAKEQWKIKYLPSYLVLNAAGEEVGRIAGEQTAEAFYGELARITRTAATVPQLQARFAKAPALLQPQLAKQILAALVDQQNPQAAQAWLEGLPAAQRQRLLGDTDVATQANRAALRLTDDPERAEAIGRKLLRAETGCTLPYEVVTMNPRIAPDPQQLPADLRQQQIKVLEPFVQQRLLGDGPACADQRTGVLVLSDLYKDAGRPEASASLLKQAQRTLIAAMGGTGIDQLRADRWRADNLRVFYAAAGDTEARMALNETLIKAFPQDYGYPDRQARILLAAERPAEALPYLELAASRTYGVNRLRVAGRHAQALAALGRNSEAIRVINAALRANKKFFPEEAAKLRAQRDDLKT